MIIPMKIMNPTTLEKLDLKMGVQELELNKPSIFAPDNTTSSKHIVVSVQRKHYKGFGIAHVTKAQEHLIDDDIYFLREIKEDLKYIRSYTELQKFVYEYKDLIDQFPLFWCAIELAIIDLISKERGQNVSKLTRLATSTEPYYFSAIVNHSNVELCMKQIYFYAQHGFTDFKLNLHGNLDVDRRNIMEIKKFTGNKARIRYEINNLWNDSLTASRYLKALDNEVFAIEEPFSACDFYEMESLLQLYKGKIILDESFLIYEDFVQIGRPKRFIIKINLSKMGGLTRALQIVEEARKRKIPVIIGGNAGESGILTSMSMLLANSARDILVAQEGAFGNYVLKGDVINEPPTFGQNGVVHWDQAAASNNSSRISRES